MGVVKVGWVGVKGAAGVGRGTTTCIGMGRVGKTVESYFIVLSVLKFKKLKIFQQGSNVRNSNEISQHFIIRQHFIIIFCSMYFLSM